MRNVQARLKTEEAPEDMFLEPDDDQTTPSEPDEEEPTLAVVHQLREVQPLLEELEPTSSAQRASRDPDPDEELAASLARRLGYVYVSDLSEFPVDAAAFELVPPRMIRRHRAMPLGFDGDVLIVAIADPANVVGLDDIRTLTGRELRVIVARPSEIDELITRHDRMDRHAEVLLQEAASDDEPSQKVDFEADDAPIVKAINQIISNAVVQRASDIHVEPQEGDIRIRYRIDGVLTEVMRTHRSLLGGLVSRLKVMSDLDIAEKRLPQDGRLTVKVEGRQVDLRVATLPTTFGEKVVLRVLDRGNTVLTLEELGFADDALDRFREAVSKPHGAVLVTGPTGSGKSTTLYAALQTISDITKNIITVEDPVEAQLEGITQMQTNPRAGLTFATALRSILRADPDVVMVGEMRDRETALIGIEAALTGHMVLSTLHTNDAASAITRLVEMGIEPFLVASSIDCSVAQRLARRLCPRCAEPYTPTRQALEEHGILWPEAEELPKLYEPVGCQYCSKTGFRGRVAIVEVMPMSSEIRGLTLEHRSAEEIKRQAISEGMRPLREDGIRKALAGITTMEEVLRVVA